MTGFFGVGGGFLIVPTLAVALAFSMRMAVGTSLVIWASRQAHLAPPRWSNAAPGRDRGRDHVGGSTPPPRQDVAPAAAARRAGVRPPGCRCRSRVGTDTHGGCGRLR
jgi:hypothetical protein